MSKTLNRRAAMTGAVSALAAGAALPLAAALHPEPAAAAQPMPSLPSALAQLRQAAQAGDPTITAMRAVYAETDGNAPQRLELVTFERRGTAASAAPAATDAELVTLGAELDRAMAAADRAVEKVFAHERQHGVSLQTDSDLRGLEQAMEAAWCAVDDVRDRIVAAPAAGLQGLAVKARALLPSFDLACHHEAQLFAAEVQRVAEEQAQRVAS